MCLAERVGRVAQSEDSRAAHTPRGSRGTDSCTPARGEACRRNLPFKIFKTEEELLDYELLAAGAAAAAGAGAGAGSHLPERQPAQRSASATPASAESLQW